MQAYRWFFIILLFLLSISGTMIASFISCIDRNPREDMEGRVLDQVPYAWILFGFMAFIVLGCLITFVAALVITLNQKKKVFGVATIVLVAISGGLAILLVGLYWTFIYQPLLSQTDDDNDANDRLEEWIIWFYFITGIVIALLLRSALTRMVSIAIQDGGCEPDPLEYYVLGEGMYKCDKDLGPISKYVDVIDVDDFDDL